MEKIYQFFVVTGVATKVHLSNTSLTRNSLGLMIATFTSKLANNGRYLMRFWRERREWNATSIRNLRLPPSPPPFFPTPADRGSSSENNHYRPSPSEVDMATILLIFYGIMRICEVLRVWRSDVREESYFWSFRITARVADYKKCPSLWQWNLCYRPRSQQDAIGAFLFGDREKKTHFLAQSRLPIPVSKAT